MEKIPAKELHNLYFILGCIISEDEGEMYMAEVLCERLEGNQIKDLSVNERILNGSYYRNYKVCRKGQTHRI